MTNHVCSHLSLRTPIRSPALILKPRIANLQAGFRIIPHQAMISGMTRVGERCVRNDGFGFGLGLPPSPRLRRTGGLGVNPLFPSSRFPPPMPFRWALDIGPLFKPGAGIGCGTAALRSPITDYRSPITDHRLPITVLVHGQASSSPSRNSEVS